MTPRFRQSVTLQDLEAFEKHNHEAFLVLMRFYTKVDRNIPDKYKPVLLGEADYAFSHIPKGFLSQLGYVVASIFLAVLEVNISHTFLFEKENGGFLVSDSTRIALKAYIKKYKPLPISFHQTNK
ncbi:MAG: hypothetical protein ACI9TY_000198 [Alphaproteobacteria bacterium]|jgi:hypothetical protein